MIINQFKEYCISARLFQSYCKNEDHSFDGENITKTVLLL